MKKYFKQALPFWAVPLALYYIAPAVLFRTVPADQGMVTMMILLLVLQPLSALWTGFLYGTQRGFWILYPAVIAVAFIPPIYLYYNPTAWPYVPLYGAMALVGNWVGYMTRRRR